ncbi:MAG: serine hydrolase [Steroidobacteraceae bacterium]|nr:serine hydrolase [Steroidobacteraceae bacterium]
MALGVAVVLGAAAALVVARDPVFWKRYMLAMVHSPGELPDTFYEPSVTLVGTHEPTPPRVRPEEERLDPEALRAAADYAGSRHTTALIVGRGGHIVFEQYWDGGDFDTMMDAGALTATLAALTVGIAMADHKIGLATEPAAHYLPALATDDRRTITLADLLRSASGLAPAGEIIGPWSPGARERFAPNLTESCLARGATAQPGTVWVPQPCDVQLLVRAIERATGQPYARYISQLLWRPIGAADAYFVRDDESGAVRGDCCLRARRGDWMRIAELLANEGRFQGEEVVPPGWVREMLTASGPHPNFGYQLWRGEPFDAAGGEASEPYAATDTYVLKGPGKTRVWFVPSLRLTILRAGTNAPDDADWDDARIPNLIIRGAADFVPAQAPSGAPDISTLVPRH